MKLGFFFKPVFTVSRREKKVRLLRFGYNRASQGPPSNAWISWVLSLTLWAHWFRFERNYDGFYLVIAGLGVHFRRSAGGYES